MIKVRVAAIILSEDKLLLVRHRRRGRSYWTFPGGGVIEGETLERCLYREIEEETGLRVIMGPLLFVTDTISDEEAGVVHIINLIFRAYSQEGAPIVGYGKQIDELNDDMAWIPLGALSTLDFYPPITEALLGVLGHGVSTTTNYLGNVWKTMEGSNNP